MREGSRYNTAGVSNVPVCCYKCVCVFLSPIKGAANMPFTSGFLCLVGKWDRVREDRGE